MSDKKSRLGKGLSALIGEYDDVSLEGVEGEAIRNIDSSEVDISLIEANPNQPRRRFDETALAELTESVKTRGVLQPILVRPRENGDKKYQIIAGERRWRAATKAGLETIPVVVREFDEIEILEIGIIENVQRADLNSIEEAEGYHALMTRFGKTQENLAETLGKSRAHIANTLRLLKLPEEARDQVRKGQVSAGHARAALGADEPEKVLDHVLSKGLSVRDTEKLVQKLRGGDDLASLSKIGRKIEKDVDTLALEADLSRALGLSVDIRGTAGNGELRIKYRDLEQLDDVCRRLTRSA